VRGLLGGYDRVDGSLAERGLDSLRSTGLELEGSIYPLPRTAFISPYVALGLGGGSLSWDYRNTVVTTSGSVDDDRLRWYQARFGAGIAIARARTISARIEAGLTLRAYDNESRRGFDNDLFEDVAALSFLVTLQARF
jgi:hypothetical protein